MSLTGFPYADNNAVSSLLFSYFVNISVKIGDLYNNLLITNMFVLLKAKQQQNQQQKQSYDL